MWPSRVVRLQRSATVVHGDRADAASSGEIGWSLRTFGAPRIVSPSSGFWLRRSANVSTMLMTICRP
jgi:hypothetical protein